MDKKFYGIFILILVIVAGGIYWAATVQEKKNGANISGIADESAVAFAQCLSEEGATFYGAWWCPHCAEQKSLFGEAAMEQINYVECSPPSGQGQTPICIEKKIQSYPTWIFADGMIAKGVQTFEALSTKTGCPIPGATSTPTSSFGTEAGAQSMAATSSLETEATDTKKASRTPAEE